MTAQLKYIENTLHGLETWEPVGILGIFEDAEIRYMKPYSESEEK